MRREIFLLYFYFYFIFKFYFNFAYFASGCVDAILCGDSYYNNASNYLKEVARVLKPNGIFVVITYGTPNSRLYYLSDEVNALQLTW